MTGARGRGAPPRRRSVTAQVSVAAFALTAAFALAAGVASWAVNHQVMQGRLLDALQLEASIDADAVEEPLRQVSHDLDVLSRSTFVTNALVDSVGRERYLVPFLREFRLSSAVPVRLTLCDHLGREVASTAEAGHPRVDGAALARAVASREPVSVVVGEMLQIASPVVFEHTGQMEGLLVAELDLRALFLSLRGEARPGTARRLLDAEGRVLVEDPGIPGDAIATRAPIAAEPARRLGLQLEVRVPRERILAPLRRLAAAYAAAGAVLAGAALLAARRLARGLTRPVRALNAAARDAAIRASFDVVVPVQGPHEVAELGATFNDMLGRLRGAAEARLASEEERRVRAEGALDLAHAALEQATDAIVILRPDGTVLYANAAAAELQGGSREALSGTPLWALRPGHVTEARWRALWEEVRRRGAVEERLDLPRGGRQVPYESRLRHLSFAGAEYCVMTTSDVSDRVRAEQAGRLASLGTLAAGVAHEINNPLTYVAGNLEWAREALGGKGRPLAVDGAAADQLRETLAEASQGASRVGEVVRALRVFSRPSSGRRVPNDVEAELRAALQLAANEIRHRARIVVELSPVPPVVAGEHELGQVFTNLLVNAAQAIPPGRADRNVIRVVAREVPPGKVVVEVSDTGVGIPRDRLPLVFEPFFTTKPAGTGTGLGLPVCQGIVSRAGGAIEVESEEGKGSTFRVTLPAAPPAPAAAAPAAEPPGRRLRVLVVDDEPAIGRIVARALAGRHELVETTSGRQALALLRAGERFDALLCDLMMPEMSGMELHGEVAALDPQLAARTVVLTGGAFDPRAREFLERSRLPVLEKPFSIQDLLSALARVTEPRAAARRLEPIAP